MWNDAKTDKQTKLIIFEGSQTVKVGKGLNSDYTQPTPLLRKMLFVLSRARDKEKILSAHEEWEHEKHLS